MDAPQIESRRTALALANQLLQQWKLMIVVPTVAVILTVAGFVAFPRDQYAQAVILPEARSSAPRFSGLAAQLGVNLGMAESGQSLEFFAQLFESRQLLRGAVLTEYTVDARGSRSNLVELLSFEGETQTIRENSAIDWLRSRTSVQYDPASGFIALRVSAPTGALAVAINRRLLELMDEFNLQRRQSQAAEERRFVEARLEEALQELLAAEGALEAFLQQNRRYQESPQLVFESARLQRRVDLRQQVYLSLSQSHEQARIEEVRTTPVVTVVDPPEGSARPVGSGVVPRVVLAGLLGLFASIAALLIRGYLENARRQDPEAYDQLTQRFRLAGSPLRSRLSRDDRSKLPATHDSSGA